MLKNVTISRMKKSSQYTLLTYLELSYVSHQHAILKLLDAVLCVSGLMSSFEVDVTLTMQ